MAKVIKASGNEIEPYWPMLFAKALKSASIDDLLTSVATAAPAAGGVAVAAAAEDAAEAEGDKKAAAEGAASLAQKKTALAQTSEPCEEALEIGRAHV